MVRTRFWLVPYRSGTRRGAHGACGVCVRGVRTGRAGCAYGACGVCVRGVRAGCAFGARGVRVRCARCARTVRAVCAYGARRSRVQYAWGVHTVCAYVWARAGCEGHMCCIVAACNRRVYNKVYGEVPFLFENPAVLFWLLAASWGKQDK